MTRVDVGPSRLRARRRRRRALIASLCAGAVLVVSGGVVWTTWAPFLRITAIDVSGTQTIATSTIEQFVQTRLAGAYAFIFPRNDILLYPRAAIAAELMQAYPTLRSADVHAENFHTIAIAVAERQPVALWCAADACSYLDETGLAYAAAPQFSGSPFVVYQGALATTTRAGLEQFLTPAQFQSLRALVDALDQKEGDDPVAQVAVDAGDANITFRSGFVLKFNLSDDGGDVFERFVLALQSSAFAGKQISDFEYLDLRFGDKLYYKAKTE